MSETSSSRYAIWLWEGRGGGGVAVHHHWRTYREVEVKVVELILSRSSPETKSSHNPTVRKTE